MNPISVHRMLLEKEPADLLRVKKFNLNQKMEAEAQSLHAWCKPIITYIYRAKLS